MILRTSVRGDLIMLGTICYLGTIQGFCEDFKILKYDLEHSKMRFSCTVFGMK